MLLIVTALATFCCQVSARQRINNNPFPVGSLYHGEMDTSPAAATSASTHRRTDISNKAKNNIITNPQAFNIYVGKSWKQSTISIIDTFSANVGKSDLWSTVQSLPNPDGKIATPLVFLGSGWDTSVDDTTAVSVPDGNKWINNFFTKFITAKTVGTTPLDFSKLDLKNTIFTLMPSANIKFKSDNTCGYHAVFNYDLVANKVLNESSTDPNVISFPYSFTPASVTVGSGGCVTSTAGQGSLNPIVPDATPNGDTTADRVIDTWTHEIFETVSDPMFEELQSWYNNDDLHFAPKAPTFTQKGGNNENADLCSGIYGLDPTKLYNTANPNNAVIQDPVTKLWSFNANVIVGGKYYLVSMQYVYSPNTNGVVNTGKSQCAMTAKNLPALPAATTTMTMSFTNTINDANGYYLLVLYYNPVNQWQYVWKSPTVKYGLSVQFSKLFPLGTKFSGLRVVRANAEDSSKDEIVASSGDNTSPIYTIDNINSMMILFWKDDQDNLFVGQYGTSGSYSTSNVVMINAAYPSGDSNAGAPSVTLTDATGAAVSTAAKSTQFTDLAEEVTSSYWQLGPLALPSTAIGGFMATCGMEGRETLKLTIPAGTTVAAGTTAFIFCTNDQKTRLFQPALATIVPSVAGQVEGTLTTTNGLVAAASSGTPITTGFMQLTQYRDSVCKLPTVTKYAQLGVCVQTGLDYADIKSASVSGSVTSFYGTPYLSSNCDPATLAPQGIEDLGVDTQSVSCTAQTDNDSYLSAFYAATIPATPPAGQLALYTYNSFAMCSAGSAPIAATFYNPTCSIYFGNAYMINLCAANTTVVSTTGGFFMQRYYNSAGCQAAPISTSFYQLNVCGQEQESGSVKYIALPYANGVPGLTVFSKIMYTSNDCSGIGSSPFAGNYYGKRYISVANTTERCIPSGLRDPNVAFKSTVFSTTLAFASGYGTARFSSQASCNQLNTAQLFSGVAYADGCTHDANTDDYYVAPGGCPNAYQSSTTQTYTQSFNGVSVAEAQSTSFRTQFVAAEATFLGLPASAIAITSVTASAGRRLLQGSTGVSVAFSVTASRGSISSLNTLVAASGQTVANAMAVAYPKINAQATITATGPTATAILTNGRSLTTFMQTFFNGIVISNPTSVVTTSATSPVLTVTQNIPSGLTLAQANSALFQTNFAQAVAASASVQASSVTFIGVTTGRRLLAGQTVMYNINTMTPTSAPSPMPTGSSLVGGSQLIASCFAGSELVTLEDGATKAMADLTVGDRILTVNAKGEQVYSDVAYLPHGRNEERTVFAVIATESGRDVKMTANHILPAGACAAQTLPMVSASQVAVGHCVETVSGREKVVSVGKVEGKGIYTAIAMEELIVVNGIVATPYGGVNPTVANIYYNLHRLMYAYAGSSLMTKSWVQSATEMLWGDLTSINA